MRNEMIVHNYLFPGNGEFKPLTGFHLNRFEMDCIMFGFFYCLSDAASLQCFVLDLLTDTDQMVLHCRLNLCRSQDPQAILLAQEVRR